MTEITTLGVVGAGFVGTAVATGFADAFDVEIYDLDEELRTVDSLVELLKLTNIVFVCVPTPMNKDGSCNTKIVESVIRDMDLIAKNRDDVGDVIAIIKSTVEPGTTARLDDKYEHVNCVHNSEFLTEANFIYDFINQDRIIIGGKRPYSTIVKGIYDKVFPNTPKIKTSAIVSELVKYFVNCFLATKLSFANEFYQICEAVGEDYDKVLEYALYDSRLGKTHFNVPSNECHPETGERLAGWSLSCFPKDLNAMISLAKSISVDPKVMQAAWDKNCEVRTYHDWNDLIGRAVTDESKNKNM